MIAVDTNVIVRFLTRDDEAQAAAALSIIRDEEVVIATTVLLEAAWVLARTYGYRRPALVEALKALASIPSVTFEEPARARRALDWFEAGLDIADALHLASAGRSVAFATFDRKLARRARQLGGAPPVRLCGA